MPMTELNASPARRRNDITAAACIMVLDYMEKPCFLRQWYKIGCMVKRIGTVLAPILLLLVVGLTLWAEVHAQAISEVPSTKSTAPGAQAPLVINPPSAPYRQQVQANTGARSAATQTITATPFITIPILMYHHVGNPKTYP